MAWEKIGREACERGSWRARQKESALELNFYNDDVGANEEKEKVSLSWHTFTRSTSSRSSAERIEKNILTFTSILRTMDMGILESGRFLEDALPVKRLDVT